MDVRLSSTHRKWVLRFALIAPAVLIAGTILWCWRVYAEVKYFAGQDQAAPADVIAVFGAAEYDGRPSPVFRARLDHAALLYDHGIASLIVTLGGDGGDRYSEGAVGRDYLMSTGIPESAIIAETKSRNTVEAVRRLTAIARANRFLRIVVVSDNTHLFRIHEICAANGLNVLTSPRPKVATERTSSERGTILHEILSYTAWKLHVE